MNIYLDLDDVLCDTAGAYLQLLLREFGKKVPFEQIFSFNLQRSFGLDDEQNRRLFALAHEADFVKNLEPLEGMVQVLEDWERSGAVISIVTGRHTASRHDTLLWLKAKGVPHSDFIMVDKYGWEGTDHEVAITLTEMARLRFDVGVEDSPEMAAYLATKMSLSVLLFDRPWNRWHTLHHSGRRCSSWSEVALAAEEIKSGRPGYGYQPQQGQLN